ncbi:CoA-transferase family III [Gloeophyllum trabeum ATCC 11539]|uniref:CoA-transferase family III n=1 Tax=Gloeophyllum trabeum (strain ATCC 11539 / FP-39264 / Madison 617) TaxID=670483 RepID=S7Q1Y3_GLOTA|nr:CoA-transferase family III [Gloeophyllum trabeum ATCC 11539]EPQ54016.1 CoA-transferase family III [Gloeophyllum trabeum ATCC 11539]
MATPSLPLNGLKVIEFAGLAPGPFAGLVLADWGAAVTRVDRPGHGPSADILCRRKRSLAINPKVPSGLAALRRLIADSDVLIDPFRPGVLEKLGLGPDVFLGEGGLNGRLVYARVAGFPRKGAYSSMAGHDINYIALSGVLSMLPGKGRPNFPLNLLADFAGGGLLCALGILLALLERAASGRGQVVALDMVSGTRYVSSFALAPGSPYFPSPRGENLLDGGAPFYAVYTCADGRWVAVGCLEPHFYTTFLEKFGRALGMGEEEGWHPNPEDQMVRSEWPRLREYLAKGFLTRPRDYWAGLFHGSDACVTPVLAPAEVSLRAPLPHPDLSRTPARAGREGEGEAQVLDPGRDTEEVLREAGFSADEQATLVRDGALGEVRARAKL